MNHHQKKKANDSTETNQPSLDKHETTSDVIEQPEASASIQTISEELNVSSDDTVQALENIGVDTSNASEVEAIAALIQNDYANNSNETPVATPLNVNSATTRNEENNKYTKTKIICCYGTLLIRQQTIMLQVLITIESLKLMQLQMVILIQLQTQRMLQIHYHGRAWVVDNNTGTPATMSNGLSPVRKVHQCICNGLIKME